MDSFTFKNTLHSLHGCRNSLNINSSQCNEACFSMSLIALLVTSGDIYDKEFRVTLHGGTLKINQLQHPCNEWNVILHLIFLLCLHSCHQQDNLLFFNRFQMAALLQNSLHPVTRFAFAQLFFPFAK